MPLTETEAAAISRERHRELAIEHLLFGTIRFLAKAQPDLVEELEGSIAHLGDLASAPDKDDEAVRDVARLFMKSLRRESAGGKS